jgi:hypothetical protein
VPLEISSNANCAVEFRSYCLLTYNAPHGST